MKQNRLKEGIPGVSSESNGGMEKMTRGSEIVYCFKCAVRLTGRELESGAALRFADFYSCSACARTLLESMSVRRKQALAERIEKTHAAKVSAPTSRLRIPRL